MADPPSTTPFEVAASQEDALLATKLHVPGPQAGLVARPRLLERLEEALARGPGAGLRPGRVRQDRPAGRLGPPAPAAGGLAVAGRQRQRPDPVLAPRGRRPGPGPTRPGRAASPAARAAGAGVVREAGHRPDQPAGRPARRR